MLEVGSSLRQWPGWANGMIEAGGAKDKVFQEAEEEEEGVQAVGGHAQGLMCWRPSRSRRKKTYHLPGQTDAIVSTVGMKRSNSWSRTIMDHVRRAGSKDPLVFNEAAGSVS